MDRLLDAELIEGEIGLVIAYRPGASRALDVLSGAMQMVRALDTLDRALLSSIDTELEPVSILNDVQHSSMKMLLARALRNVPDDHLKSGDWKRWAGALLVKGKHALLKKLDADAPHIQGTIDTLKPDYAAAPALIGFDPPRVGEVQAALAAVAGARRTLAGQAVTVQTEFGDIALPDVAAPPEPPSSEAVAQVVNRGREWLKVRYPDMLGAAQWTVLRAGRNTRVDILHKEWLDAYHRRDVEILPGDALDCDYEETIGYDAARNEVERRLAIVCVHSIQSPPRQDALL